MNLKERVFLDRTLRIPWFDRKKMKELRVTVIGAGNTGSQLLIALHGLGLGRIDIFDRDVVELSNVQRQILYSERDIGKPKAHAAAEFLKNRFSGLSTEIKGHVYDVCYLMQLGDADYVFCCVDNDETRRRVLIECLDRGIPVIDMGLEFRESQAGYVLVVDRNLFPDGACTNCFMELDGSGYGEGGCVAAGITYSGGIVANVAAGMFVQHVHRRLKRNFFFTDLNSCTAEFMHLKRRASCRLCKKR